MKRRNSLQGSHATPSGLKTTMSEESFNALCKVKREANSSGVPTFLHCQTCEERPKELTIKKFGGFDMQLQAQCPATSGLKTAMSEEAFLSLCKLKREANSSGVPTFLHCQTCEERPKELTIKKFGGTVRMSKRTGKCESCGKVSTIQNHLGKGVCSMCLNLRSNVKNKPDVVLATLREFGITTTVDPEVKDMEEAIQIHHKTIAMLEEKLSLFELEEDSLNKEIEQLKDTIRDKRDNGISPMDQLALGIMDGSIKGVSLDHYRELRGEG